MKNIKALFGERYIELLITLWSTKASIFDQGLFSWLEIPRMKGHAYFRHLSNNTAVARFQC